MNSKKQYSGSAPRNGNIWYSDPLLSPVVLLARVRVAHMRAYGIKSRAAVSLQ